MIKKFEQFVLENFGKDINTNNIKHTHDVNKNEIKRKRFITRLQPNLDKIVEAIEDVLNDIEFAERIGGDKLNFDDCVLSFDFDINLGNQTYNIFDAEFEIKSYLGDTKKERGFTDATYTLLSFSIGDENDEDCYATNDELGITFKTYKDLFEPYNVEFDYDEYDYAPTSVASVFQYYNK